LKPEYVSRNPNDKKAAPIFLNHVLEDLYAKHFGVLSIRKSEKRARINFLSVI